MRPDPSGPQRELDVIQGVYRNGMIELERLPDCEESDVCVTFSRRVSNEERDRAWAALLAVCEKGFDLGGEPWTREELYRRGRGDDEGDEK